MRGFSEDDKGRLLLLLMDQELEKFGQLRELGKTQMELLEADDVDAFNMSIDSGQEIIDKISGLHQETQTLMQSYISNLNPDGGAGIEEIETAAARLRDMIAECAGQNDKIAANAKERAGSYMERIGTLRANRKGLDTYIQKIASDPKLFDKKM